MNWTVYTLTYTKTIQKTLAVLLAETLGGSVGPRIESILAILCHQIRLTDKEVEYDQAQANPSQLHVLLSDCGAVDVQIGQSSVKYNGESGFIGKISSAWVCFVPAFFSGRLGYGRHIGENHPQAQLLSEGHLKIHLAN